MTITGSQAMMRVPDLHMTCSTFDGKSSDHPMRCRVPNAAPEVAIAIGSRSYMNEVLHHIPMNDILSVVVGVMLLAMLLFYVVARVSLLILAIITLRKLPPSAFDTIQWASVIPHV